MKVYLRMASGAERHLLCTVGSATEVDAVKANVDAWGVAHGGDVWSSSYGEFFVDDHGAGFVIIVDDVGDDG